MSPLRRPRDVPYLPGFLYPKSPPWHEVVYMFWLQRADSAHNSTPGDNDIETLLSMPWVGLVFKHKYLYDDPPVIFVHENKPQANISSANIA